MPTDQFKLADNHKNPLYDIDSDGIIDQVVESGVWSEDSNSPKEVTGSNSLTYTVSDAYDVYLVMVEMVDQADTSNDLEIQLNGHTSTYKYRKHGGGTSSGQSSFKPIINPNLGREYGRAILYVAGNGDPDGDQFTAGYLSLWNSPFQVRGTGDTLAYGNIGDGSEEDLSEIKMLRGASTNYRIRVFGRDIRP